MGIPTRNRADLAIAAVKSILRSDHPRVAVIVSDNSTEEDERERLRDFCASRGAGAVEYVRPAEPLPMATHWEWLRATIQERVEPTHLTYLTDRMVFTAGALAELMGAIAANPADVISYNHDRVEDAEVPVQLVQTQWTGRLFDLDARRLLAMSSRGAYGDHLPRMLNSVGPMAVFDDIQRRFGSVFESVAPDYAFAYRCLAVRDRILYLDRACLIHYGMARSAGVTYLRGRPNEDAAAFQQSLTVARFGKTPEPRFETVANAIFQEYCAAREAAGDDRFPPVDMPGYLGTNAISVSLITDPDWRARMEDLLRAHGWTRGSGIRGALGRGLAMAGYFVRHPGALARSLRRQLWDRPPGTPAANLFPRVGIDPRIREDLTFGSAAEAIAHAEAHPRARTPYSWLVHTLRRAGAVVRESAPPSGR